MHKVTIYTLAKELNMTPTMISRAFDPNGKISEDKRKIVLAAAQKYNFSPNKFASRLSMKAVNIGILINSRFSVNTEKMKAGINGAYEKIKDYKVTYDITVTNPLINKPEDYTNILRSYQSYDAVIISGMSSEKYTDMINELYAVNPNVVQVQAINNSANYLFASKHNEETASQLAAEFLYNCLKRENRKNILLFTGDKESTLHSSAGVAFKKACDKLQLNLLDSIDMKDNEDYFNQIIPKAFEKYGDETDGIYITSGFCAPLCKYIEENNIDVTLVGFDTSDSIKAYMEKGIVSATISQNVENQMAIAFESLVKYLIMGQRCPKTLYTDIQLVLKSNIHQY